MKRLVLILSLLLAWTPASAAPPGGETALRKAGVIERLARDTGVYHRAPGARTPGFVADPSWPQPLPHHWMLGQIGGLYVDAHDHVWVYNRPRSMTNDEAGLEGLVLFLVLLWATHRKRWLNREGAVVGLFLVGYGLARVSLENVRQPDAQMPDFPLGLTMGMMLSIPMILVGAWLVWRALHRPPAPPEPDSEPQSAALAAE